jgi:hypothetical protein
MLKRLIKRGLLPNTSSGWKSVSERIMNDNSEDNLFDRATRVLVSFIFAPDLKDNLETTMIKEISNITNCMEELVVIVFKTAKMHAACMRDMQLLNGLYQFGLTHSVKMRYTIHDYVFDDTNRIYTLDYNGVARKHREAAFHKYISDMLQQSKGANQNAGVSSSDLSLDNPPENLSDGDADKLIDQWKKRIKGKSDIN